MERSADRQHDAAGLLGFQGFYEIFDSCLVASDHELLWTVEINDFDNAAGA